MSSETNAVEAIIDRMRSTPDVKEKVEIAGLARKPFKDGDFKQSCANCIYFLPQHSHCDLPELNFPVDGDWWCRLWRM
jgi:hypothetical protein